MAPTGTNLVFEGWNPDWTKNGLRELQTSSYRTFDHSTCRISDVKKVDTKACYVTHLI